MSARVEFWVIIGVLALGTYLMRAIPIVTFGRKPMPHWLERVLRHVPAAALAALVVPGSLYSTSGGSYDVAPERIVAAAVAMFIALKWKNMLATLVAGMAVLWAMQAVL